MIGDLFDGLGAGALKVGADFLGGGAERAGDALAGVGDLRIGVHADGVEALAQRAVGRQQRSVQLPALRHQGAALVAQFGDERAHPAVIFGEGVFDRGDFAADKLFEFGGPRQRGFDAVAHRPDLVADGLTERAKIFGGAGVGLGQPRRNLRYRGGGLAKFADAPRQRRQAKKQDGGPKRAERQKHELRRDVGLAHREPLHVAASDVDVEIGGAQADPQQRSERRQQHRRAADRPHLQGLHERSDGRPVVVGRRARRTQRRGSGLGGGTAQQLLGRLGRFSRWRRRRRVWLWRGGGGGRGQVQAQCGLDRAKRGVHRIGGWLLLRHECLYP